LNTPIEDDESFTLNRGENKGVLLQLLGDEIIQKQGKGDERNLSKKVGPMAQLLEEFADIFANPKELPPKRSHDHAIHLKEGAQPVSVRPYRYPFYQKEEIEKIVRELLQSGVIRCNQSPFSSPVLLVRKADGSWRMCMDYRALNQVTIKDKFPIPVVDELSCDFLSYLQSS
jgi:hypothetical protein